MLRTLIERPIAVGMLFLALVLIGLLSFGRLPVDLLPGIVHPRLTVITTYEEIPAQDVERLVTRPIEEVVTALTGVRRVHSRSREGVSMITVEYEWGTQMDFANLHLREAVDRVAFREDFPDRAERPLILRWDPTSRPISILVLRGEGELRELTEFAREVVKPALEQVDGVSQAEVVGGSEREILVQPDPEKLAIYGIDIEAIRRALASANVSFPGGKIRRGPLHLSLRIAGEYETLEEIGATEIALERGVSVRVEDVARVLDAVKKPEGVTLLGAEPVVSILLYKEPEANTIQVSERVDRALSVVKEEYGAVGYRFVYRDAEYVRASFSGLLQSIALGAGLAFLVLIVFLRDLRSPLVVGISIPVSILITFAFLYFGKVKLNLMSLGGISLATGMLVDNAIVVLENINRHISERFRSRGELRGPGERREVAEAADVATREVARPVVAATLTTVAVFFPVVYVPGIAGAFFRDQALSVTFALLVSVTTALLLQPVLSARVLRRRTGPPRGLFRLSAAAFESLHGLYHRLLVRALRRRVPLVASLLVVLAGCALLGAGLDRSLMPQRSSGDLRRDLELPAGTPLEETHAAAGRIAGWLEDDPEVREVFSQVGRTERTLAAMQEFAAANTARMRIFLRPGRGAAARGERIREELAARLDSIPEAGFAFREEGVGLAEILSTGEAGFRLGILAEDPLEAVEAAERLREEFRGIDGLYDLRIDRVLGTPSLVISLDRELILRSGLSPEAVARELRNRIGGVEATTFNEIDQRIDIAVRFEEGIREDLAAALSTPVAVAGGRTVPLRSFLRVTEETPVRELVRQNQRRMVSLEGSVSGRPIGEVWDEAVARAGAIDLPMDVAIFQAGESVAMRESFREMGWALLLAVLLVYMILAAQFESFLDPLLISAVLPIGAAGSILAIAIAGESVNLLSLIGLVALLGIAVNDAIVKIDTIRRLREEGLDPHEAVLEGSRLRFRPILMTSATTVLAMVPLAIGIGGGEQLQRPLAVTIIGGLTLTTLVTLFFTPVLYEIAHRIPRARR